MHVLCFSLIHFNCQSGTLKHIYELLGSIYSFLYCSLIDLFVVFFKEERLKKKVENLAKEEAAHVITMCITSLMFCLLLSFQERRKAIEAERQAKLLELDCKRREQVF